MSVREELGTSSNADSFMLNPARPSSKANEALSDSPRFSPPSRIYVQRSLYFSTGQELPTSTPLDGQVESSGEAKLAKVGSSHLLAVERDFRSARSPSAKYASEENQSRIVSSPRANDKAPIPIFSRVPSMRASLNRNLSSKDAAASRTLNRLLSMEKGENWKWSPYDEHTRDEFSFNKVGGGAELDDRVLENKSQYDGSLSLWKILKQGSPTSKRLLVLITLNFAYSATEFLVGLFTGRIGLVSDSFHLTFGCGVLTFSLFAMVRSKFRPNEKYTYGYDRLEVLAAFTNALFLLFLSFSLAVEALHAFVQDESEHKHYLIVSAVANLIVNLLGVSFFRSYARVRVVYRKAEDMNNHSICLHVLSDSIRSAGVVLASWLLAVGVKYAETLCLGLVAVAVFLTTMPLFKASGGVLLQMAPPGISHSAFSKCQRQVMLLEEVLDCYKARFWDIVPGSVVGTLCIQIKAGSDEQKILKHVHSIYNDIGVKDLTVQLELKQQ